MTTDDSLRILDLCEFFSDRGGGVRSYLEAMGHAAHERGHQLTVFAPGAGHETSEHSGMRLVRYPAPRMPYDNTYRVPWRLDLMRRIVAHENPHIVQISSPFAPALAARLLPKSARRVYFYHSDPIGCYIRPALRRSLPDPLAERVEHAAWGWQRAISRSCDATVVAGHWLEELLKQHGCQRVRTVPFGIRHGDLGPERADPVLRQRLLGPLADQPRATLLLIAGRLGADKRQGLVVEALARVQRERPVALVVLGDGPERETLRQKARALGHVTFLPFTRNRAEFAAILASVDALVHGSVCETFGFVIAEALASGTPIVVPEAGGACAMAHPDYAETYPACAGPEQLARAVQRLLERERDSLRRAARAAGRALPSSDGHFDDLFDLYRNLLTPQSESR